MRPNWEAFASTVTLTSYTDTRQKCIMAWKYGESIILELQCIKPHSIIAQDNKLLKKPSNNQ